MLREAIAELGRLPIDAWERDVAMPPRLYQARFGAPPPAILAAIDAMHDAETLDHWADLFTARSAEEIAAALAPATSR